MNQFEYTPIERIAKISKEDFMKNYVKPQKPVVIEKLTEDWEAFEKWNLNYIKSITGNKIVPLYNNDPTDFTKKVNEPIATMTMTDYINILESGPTDLRIFLYNIIKEVPELQKEFKYPDLGLKLLKGFPMLFFGGTGSNVFMHYDIDMPNILHYHFHGKKRCVIVEPKYTKYMYRLPLNWICREDIDFDNPNFEKFPALKYVKPLYADLSHGEMLYMPEGYWHYMKYLSPGFSMSLRSLATKPKNLIEGLSNLFIIRNIDNIMRKIGKQKWIDYRDEKAMKDTNKLIKNFK